MVDEKKLNCLRGKLARKSNRVKTRYDFYEMKNFTRDFQISTPPQLAWFMPTLGWCAKAVDSLADRLTFKGFKDDNFLLEDIFSMNNPDVFFSSSILSALISSCCFVYITLDPDRNPRLQVIDGYNATGIMDELTGMLKEGYAVLERDDNGLPTLEAYFATGFVEYFYKDGRRMVMYNSCPFPTLVPIIYRPDAKRPFGHSRISRACMELQSSAVRTIKRSEIGAEFFSYPQKYVTGLSPDAEIADKWKAAMSAMMIFDKDEDGDHPIPGQFTTQSMTPHLEQLRMFASLFGGETGLTLDDLGFASGNPASSDAIKAAHENLRLTARKAQSTFGTGFLNVGIVAACLRDNYKYERKAFYRTKPKWNPVFEADGASLGAIGDAIIKINQAIPNYFTEEKLDELIGL